VGSRPSLFPKALWSPAVQKLRRPERLRLAITSIAPGGQGVAHIAHGDERRAVFVARTAPGDVLEAEVDFEHRPARVEAVRLLEPSELRAAAPCPVSERCGGCDLMHLTRDAQHDVHRRIARELLERATRSAVPEIPMHAAPTATQYRTRARFAVLANRGRAVVGYRRAVSRHIEDITACLVLDERLHAALPLLHRLFEGERGEGEAAVALGDKGRPVLDLRWRGNLEGTFFARLAHHVQSGDLAGAEVWLSGALEPARIGDPRAVTVGADGEALFVPSGGFAQAHASLNVELGRTVLAFAGIEASAAAETSRPVVELFAGSGNFTVLLARHTPALVAVETEARAAAASRANLAARGLSARIVEGDADNFEFPPKARTVVLDPPRAGAAGAARRLAASKVRRVVYVSCDATTLARDVETLVQGGFRLRRVEMFEMFPHTSHIELLALLERAPGASRIAPAVPPGRSHHGASA
jgi:23S rRNA (uracil1939-C5)-methyltransferase